MAEAAGVPFEGLLVLNCGEEILCARGRGPGPGAAALASRGPLHLSGDRRTRPHDRRPQRRLGRGRHREHGPALDHRARRHPHPGADRRRLPADVRRQLARHRLLRQHRLRDRTNAPACPTSSSTAGCSRPATRTEADARARMRGRARGSTTSTPGPGAKSGTSRSRPSAHRPRPAWPTAGWCTPTTSLRRRNAGGRALRLTPAHGSVWQRGRELVAAGLAAGDARSRSSPSARRPRQRPVLDLRPSDPRRRRARADDRQRDHRARGAPSARLRRTALREPLPGHLAGLTTRGTIGPPRARVTHAREGSAVAERLRCGGGPNRRGGLACVSFWWC